MDKELVRKVVNMYAEELDSRGIMAVQLDNYDALYETFIGTIKPLQHARWMCDQIIEKLETEGFSEKVNRWLGFLQGILWIHELYTLNEQRDHNRGC